MCIKEGKQAGGANIWYAVLAEIGGLRAVCRGWPARRYCCRACKSDGLYLRHLFQASQSGIQDFDMGIGLGVCGHSPC